MYKEMGGKLPAASRGASHSIRSPGDMGVSFQNRGVSRPARQRSSPVGRPGLPAIASLCSLRRGGRGTSSVISIDLIHMAL
jgi:hypothetical protein